MHKLNKGDLVRAKASEKDKGLGLVIGYTLSCRPRVLWLSGYWEGQTTAPRGSRLAKLEVESV